MTGAIRLRRAYEAAGPDEGWRVLVDRLWPRGMRRADLAFDAWMKEAAPSAALRRWFGHNPSRWSSFRDRYFAELDGRPDVVADLLEVHRRGRVTLIYAARDREHNHALALRDYLLAQPGG